MAKRKKCYDCQSPMPAGPWVACKACLKSRDEKRKKEPRYNSLLTRIVECSLCGEMLGHRNKSGVCRECLERGARSPGQPPTPATEHMMWLMARRRDALMARCQRAQPLSPLWFMRPDLTDLDVAIAVREACISEHEERMHDPNCPDAKARPFMIATNQRMLARLRAGELPEIVEMDAVRDMYSEEELPERESPDGP